MTKVLFDILADPEAEESVVEGPARAGRRAEGGVWGGGRVAGAPAIKGACAWTCAGDEGALMIWQSLSSSVA